MDNKSNLIKKKRGKIEIRKKGNEGTKRHETRRGQRIIRIEWKKREVNGDKPI